MSATLIATDLSAGHGARRLFSGLDLVVTSGDVVGLLGPNGAGNGTSPYYDLLGGQILATALESGAVTSSAFDHSQLAPVAQVRIPLKSRPRLNASKAEP